MKIVKASDGKKTIKMSKAEWTSIGKKDGWLKSKADSLNPQTYEYYVNLDERGEWYSDVRDSSGETIFSIADMEALNDLIESGYIKSGRDLRGLKEYLDSVGLISDKSQLVDGNERQDRFT